MGADCLRKNWVECGGSSAQSCHAMTRYSIFETAAGFCAIAWSGLGVVRFQLPRKAPSPLKRPCCAERPKRRLASPLRKSLRRSPPRSVISQAKRRIFPASGSTSATRTPSSSSKILDEAARRIGWGRTTTYGALAKDICAGPEAARDVGTAMAQNPVPLIVPCHRVLDAGGKVGGFSVPGGAADENPHAGKSRVFASRRLRRFSGPSRSEGPLPMRSSRPAQITHHPAVGCYHMPGCTRPAPQLVRESVRGGSKRALDPAGIMNPGVLANGI